MTDGDIWDAAAARGQANTATATPTQDSGDIWDAAATRPSQPPIVAPVIPPANNVYQAVPGEQTPEGHAAAVAQREAQHPIVTGLGEAAGDVFDSVKSALNPMNSGLLGASKEAYEHIKEVVPLFQSYESARASGKGFVDSLSAANDKAKEINDAQDALKKRVDEFKSKPAAATTRALADAAAIAATFWDGPEGLKAPEASVEAKAAGGITPKVPHEVAARNLAKAVNPQISEWPTYIKANADEGGNVVAYAMDHNRPLHTQLDYAKAARSAADETRAMYKDKILAPVGGDIVSVAGSNYQGPRVGEGQDATLNAVDRRITKINNELRPGFIKTETGKVMTAIANEADLTAERDALTKILHKELSARTGIKAEDIAAIRQRFGKMYTIADETEAAVNQRQSTVSKQNEGRRDVPLTVTSAGIEGFNRAFRGGPEGIANRAFRKALPDLGDIPTSDLPEVKPQIKPVRERAKLPTSTGTEIGVKTTSDAEIAAQKAKISDRASTVQNARTEAAKKTAQNKATHGPNRGESDATGEP